MEDYTPIGFTMVACHINSLSLNFHHIFLIPHEYFFSLNRNEYNAICIIFVLTQRKINPDHTAASKELSDLGITFCAKPQKIGTSVE